MALCLGGGGGRRYLYYSITRPFFVIIVTNKLILNLKVMPWDYDADVQITEADMYYLAAYHNMTVYYYKYGGMDEGRYFQLEINPYFKHREQDDKSNVIDGRWIDMQNGLYIDITAARYDLDHEEGEGILYDKYGHEYRV